MVRRKWLVSAAVSHSFALITVFSAFVSGYDDSSEVECTLTQQLAITVCAKPLYDYDIFGKSKQTNGLGFSWNIFSRNDKSHFGKICSGLYVFDTCIKNKRAKNDCFSEEPIKSQYVPTFALLEYFCKEKRQEVAKNYGCISNHSNSPFVSLCQKNLIRRISSISSEKSSEEIHLRAEFCSVLNEFVDCIYINFDRECDSTVAELIKGGIKRSTRIVLPECGSYRKSASENTKLGSFLICSVLLLFLH